ncbi:3-hydroxyacyl-CoA dehydrogenase NAD-binding domain-containing protein [Variovorax sp. PAMC 28711]|uniref:3-hydroxyacyl-CoA dehydrogenase NAD-binding domain-containing protein n=1 Tax=Variovorax sp. PAMC 28711 TaxID=1795631 RepID=UPI00078D5127|nr:3-hydroxyacyl-CoA dehydrogenase NAD-binding domain-containing protein [Variovorax sp. PAMC 28711]AMM23605.1 3-hydroxyacyl-CoA dehydrogenase [Variovorax sp. PAMC 28711]
MVTPTLPARTLTIDGEIGILAVSYPPVNALSQVMREAIVEGMREANANPAIKAVVLICEGRTFVAGADITEFGKPPQTPSLRDAQDQIEGAGKPVIAAIHGTALGGGLEVALCCHYRVAVPGAKCGLPEILLGLLPGAGGTQRLPRIVGVEKALDMILNGSHVPATQCLAMGLVDELVPEGELRAGAIAFARKVLAEGRPLRKVRDTDDKLIAARGHPEIFAQVRKANARKFRGFPAPEANIQCIEAAVNGSFDEGLATERKLFMELVAGTPSIAQRYAFFAERKAAKIPDVPDDTPIVKVAKVGIIGAGTMGGGIAMNFANVGIPVILVETQQAALDRGLALVRKNYENSAKRGRFTTEQVEQRMGLLTGSLEMEALADCDLVIEAVFENMAVKKEIFGTLDRICKPGAVLATNTSALDVNEIATAATSRPEAVVGMHFFSPANVMKLLEVVRGTKTSNTALATAMHIGKKVGKVAAVSGVCPGFIGNRILAARGAQAQMMVMEGAMPWDIDQVLYDFGMPMGPFAMSDLAGLDIGWSKDTSKSATVREVLCEMDRRGQKTGAGYYDYEVVDGTRTAQPSEVTRKLILDFMAKQGKVARAVSKDEILERCTYAMVNEGAKILEEGIAVRASDIDVVWINGYGWPVYRGGPMFYADTVGLDTVVAKLKAYGDRMGPGFTLSPLLERLAAEGKTFTR